MSASTTYQILQNGENLGDFTADQARHYLTDGSLHPEDLAWAPGMESWQPLHTLFLSSPPVESLPPTPATPTRTFPQPLRSTPPPLLSTLVAFSSDEPATAPTTSSSPPASRRISSSPTHSPQQPPPLPGIPQAASSPIQSPAYIPAPSIIPAASSASTTYPYIPVRPQQRRSSIGRIIIAITLILLVLTSAYLLWQNLQFLPPTTPTPTTPIK